MWTTNSRFRHNLNQTLSLHSRFSVSVQDKLRIPPTLVNGLILLLWLWLFRPLWPYFAIIFGREDFRTNQIVLVGILALLGMQLWQAQLRFRPSTPLHLALGPLLLTLSGTLLYLLVERTLAIHTLSAALFGLASYGLIGLWITPERWRAGLPVALLLIAALPFNEHLQTFVGYPLRLLTAQMVSRGLAAADITNVGLDTILLFENGISHIDLPCSGVKSLWAGLIFLLAVTWVQRRPLNLRWLGVAAGFALLLLLANLTRVAILIGVGQVAGWRLLAEMLHVPLGVIGFVAACLVVVVARGEERGGETSTGAVSGEQAARDNGETQFALIWLGPVLIGWLVGLIWLSAPSPAATVVTPTPAWNFPSEFVYQAQPLTAQELTWLTEDGAESAERWRFRWRGVSGTLLLIPSRTWRAHHNPERCLLSAGLAVNQRSTHLVTPTFPVRYLLLDDKPQGTQVAATYWLQSADRATDDYATRLWADLRLRPQRWVLAAILFDQPYDPQLPAVTALYHALHQVVAGGF